MAGEEKKKKDLKEINKLQEEEISLLKKKVKIQGESYNLSNNLLDDLKEVMGVTSRRTTADSNLLKINKEMNKAILNQVQGISSVDKVQKQIEKNHKLISKSLITQKGLELSIGDEQKKKVTRIAKAQDLAERMQATLDEELSKAERGEAYDKEAIKNKQEQLKRADALIDKGLRGLDDGGKQLLLTQMQTKELKKQNDEREKEKILAEKIKKSLGVAGGLTKLLGSIPGLGGFAADALSKVTKEIEEAADETGKVPTRLQTMGKVLKEVGKGLIHNLTDPMVIGVALITQFTKALKATDKEAGEMAKSMGISYQNALHLNEAANKTALTYGDILVSSHDIEKAQVAINKHFGTAIHFSEDMAANFASIQKRTGHSVETMGFFAKSAMMAGKEIDGILLDTHKVVLEQNQQNKLAFNVKDIQEGIAKTSKSLQLTYKLNTKELANSVIEAKKLGISLSDVEAIAGHLLDFESSIQSELQAELLLGKDINLEKARQLALEGDMAGVAKEVLKNNAIMNAFDTKNVIAQEAAAKALGMNREQLAGMVMEQKNLELLQSKYGNGITSMSEAQTKYNEARDRGLTAEQAAAGIADESLKAQLESASQAEKFEATMARVQEIFVSMATPVLGLVDGILDMAGGAERLANILKVMAGIYIGIKAAQAISILMAKKQAWEEKKILGFKVGQASASMIINPVAGLIGLAAAAAVGGLIYSSMKDGMIDPQGGMVVSGPKGSIQLDKDDSIVAGTDLGGGNPTPGSNKMVQEQLQETKTQNQLLSQLIGNTSKLKDLDSVSFYEIQ